MQIASRWILPVAMLGVLVVSGCGQDGLDGNQSPQSQLPDIRPYDLEKLEFTDVRSVTFYESKLEDRSFVWDGPTSHADRIPASHALRALSFIGDAAVPCLLRIAATTTSSDQRIGVYDALAEVGLPVNEFPEVQNGDTVGISKWWKDNRESSMEARTVHRNVIGLPPPNLYDESGTRVDALH